MKVKLLKNRTGFALVFVYSFVLLITGVVGAYLYLSAQGSSSYSVKMQNTQAFYGAEAGLAEAVQYLQNNGGGGGGIWNPANGIQPNIWNRALGRFPAAPGEEPGTLTTNDAISFNFIVDNWNLAYNITPPFAGTVAQSTNALGLVDSQQASNVVDGNVTTEWQTQTNPGIFPVILTIQFPNNSNYTINEIRIRRQGGQGRPTAYTWSTSTDGITYTPAISSPPGAGNEWCDFFNTPATNVNYLRMTITNATNNRVYIREIEIPWIRIRSRCQIASKSGISYTEKYIRTCVLSSSRGAGATIYKITPSAIAGTNITSIWDEIPRDTYYEIGVPPLPPPF